MKRADRPPPADLEPEEDALFRRLSGAAGPCPDPARIQAALADVFPEGDARDVREHLEACPACAELAAWEGPELSPHEEERIWKRVSQSAAPSPRRAARRWMLPAAAAALFAVAVPAYMLVLVKGNVEPSPSPRAGGESPAPGPMLGLDKLTVRTPPGAALVWRDGGPSYERDLREALAPYEAGDLAQAARRLEALAAKNPRAAAAPLYRGVALLLLDRPAEAAAALAAARERAAPFWMPHAQWYLAVASERAGDPARAAALLRELCGGGSEYDALACAGARALSGRRP